MGCTQPKPFSSRRFSLDSKQAATRKTEYISQQRIPDLSKIMVDESKQLPKAIQKEEEKYIAEMYFQPALKEKSKFESTPDAKDWMNAEENVSKHYPSDEVQDEMYTSYEVEIGKINLKIFI